MRDANATSKSFCQHRMQKLHLDTRTTDKGGGWERPWTLYIISIPFPMKLYQLVILYFYPVIFQVHMYILKSAFSLKVNARGSKQGLTLTQLSPSSKVFFQLNSNQKCIQAEGHPALVYGSIACVLYTFSS
jgi:hypothetical protein